MISRKSVWVGGALIAAALIAGVGWLATDHGAARIESGGGASRAAKSGPANETRGAARIGGDTQAEHGGERTTAQPRPKSRATLAGRVVDGSELPIAGAEARLSAGVGNDRRARTGADGRFRSRSIPTIPPP